MADAKKKSPVKMILMIIVPLLAIGGIVVGLGVAGIVKIPGITKTKKKTTTDVPKEEAKPEAVVKKVPEKEEPPAPKPELKLDLKKGAATLAETWNTIPNDKLLLIQKDWDDEDLSLVLAAMEPEKTGQLLASMEPKRASKLSEIMQRNAATPKTE